MAEVLALGAGAAKVEDGAEGVDDDEDSLVADDGGFQEGKIVREAEGAGLRCFIGSRWRGDGVEE